MSTSLVEAYKNRIKIAESVYSGSHAGEKMDNNRKLCLARVLANTSKFLNESFGPANATQFATSYDGGSMGDYKKFCL